MASGRQREDLGTRDWMADGSSKEAAQTFPHWRSGRSREERLVMPGPEYEATACWVACEVSARCSRCRMAGQKARRIHPSTCLQSSALWVALYLIQEVVGRTGVLE